MANQYMNMTYQAFLKQGLSPNQARALTAEVGRENDFNPRHIFGNHTDRANGKNNIGFFSWQGDRANNLMKQLNANGLIKNGKIEQSQRTLDTMAAFAINEMQTNKAYEETRRKFLKNPNVDYQTAQRVLGKNYIKWDYNGKTLGKGVYDHHAKRDRYYNQLAGANPTPTLGAQIGQQIAQAATPTRYTHNGLRLKSREAVGGGEAHQGTYALAHNVQKILGDKLKYYTALNDTYHNSNAYFAKIGKKNSGLHGAGLAMDIALNNPKDSAAASAAIKAELNAKGLREGVDYKLLDEYANPSKGATGGHLDLRFLNAAAAEKYHTGGVGGANEAGVTNVASTAAPKINSPQLTQAPRLNFETTAPTQFTNLQEQNNAKLSDWANINNINPNTTTDTTQQAKITQRNEDWRIKPLNFNIETNEDMNKAFTPPPDPYADKFATAFGEVPDTDKSLPDHISALIRNIYDNA